MKKIKKNIKKSKNQIVKLRKKAKKDSSASLEDDLNKTTRQLYTHYKDLGDAEESILENIKKDELDYLNNILTRMRPVMKEELKLFKLCQSATTLIEPEPVNKVDTTKEKEVDKDSERGSSVSKQMNEQVPDLIQRSKSLIEPSTMGSRSGSFMSLSSFASYTYREENSFRERREGGSFTTVRRSPSQPCHSILNHPDRRRELRRKYEMNRPPLPPLPPPRANSSLSNKEESLVNLRQKLDQISGFNSQHLLDKHDALDEADDTDDTGVPSTLIPRTAYMEDNTMKELHYKLLSLTTQRSVENSSIYSQEQKQQYNEDDIDKMCRSNVQCEDQDSFLDEKNGMMKVSRSSSFSVSENTSNFQINRQNSL